MKIVVLEGSPAMTKRSEYPRRAMNWAGNWDKEYDRMTKWRNLK